MVPPESVAERGAAAADGAQAVALHHLPGRCRRSASGCGSGWATASGAGRATAGCMPSWRWCWWCIGYHHGCGVLLRRFEAGTEPAQPPLVPLVQRAAGAAAAGDRDAGGRQAVLSPVAAHAQDRRAAPGAGLCGADRLRQPLPVRRLARPGHRALGLPGGALAQVLDRLRLRHQRRGLRAAAASWPRSTVLRTGRAPARARRRAARHAGRRGDLVRHGDAAELPAGAHSVQRRPGPQHGRRAGRRGAGGGAGAPRRDRALEPDALQLVRRGVARRPGAAGAVAGRAAVSGGGHLRAGPGVRAARGRDLRTG